MANPGETLERVRAAQDLLLSRLRDLTDEVARQPSRLPGWSVAHVLADRADPAELFGRLTGRGPAPVLPAWR